MNETTPPPENTENTHAPQPSTYQGPIFILALKLRATGHHGAPDTYEITHTAQTSIDVGTEWLFYVPNTETHCLGEIYTLRALRGNKVEYVVRNTTRRSFFLLITEQKNTTNPFSYTAAHWAMHPILRRAQYPDDTRYPWGMPHELYNISPAPPYAMPIHHTITARCISHGLSENFRSTWRLVSSERAIEVGMYVDFKDSDDPHTPIGPAKIAGIRTVERDWIEFTIQIHPLHTRNNASQTNLAVPAERTTLPRALEAIFPSIRPYLTDTLGDTRIFPSPRPNLLHRIGQMISSAH